MTSDAAHPGQSPHEGVPVGTSADADLVIDTLVMAFERRRPDQGVIHHTIQLCDEMRRAVSCAGTYNATAAIASTDRACVTG